ncbi:MAG TPA: UvrD-helicase domain-containing protein, partial [Solirubrobacterales bacterium]|nr:UvrD-helicase domain-containing protein [Solirubrobacterales bacterium]
MPEEHPTLASAASERERALAHEDGPLLVVGAPGTGKTELLARRLARLVGPDLRRSDLRPENVLMIASRQATAARLRERCEALLQGSFEELWVGSWDAIGEGILREYPEEAGLDPFFDVLGRAERLAMLLDRLDKLPLRRHEIRGNPA